MVKGIVVGVNLNNQADFIYSMEELSNLAAAAGIEVVAETAMYNETIDIRLNSTASHFPY
ncbi:MAG: hypothetical protein ACOX3A_05600 [bacterium]|jgi:GTP-binding protein HflX